MSDSTPQDDLVASSSQPPVKVPLILEDCVSVLAMALLACITFANVVVRYLTDSSFAWTEEFSIFLLIVVTMTASSTAFVRSQHIRIEFLADAGPRNRQRAMAILATLCSVLFFIALTILSARMVYDEYTWGDTSPAIGVPTWWYSIWVPLLAAVITLRLTGMLHRLLRASK
ncbi:MAG: TRAP transporter small permease [Alcaligenaceae bacterium]|nr:TRAP transporter small permease [Alcaligenaceae bacterium]